MYRMQLINSHTLREVELNKNTVYCLLSMPTTLANFASLAKTSLREFTKGTLPLLGWTF